MINEFKDWLKRRKLDFKYGDMVTLITLSSFKNDQGLTELKQEWTYIRKGELNKDAKEITGAWNHYLLDLTEKQNYPEWAVNQKSLTATTAYDWLLSTKILDKIYNEFKGWQHIDFKPIFLAAVVLLGAIYAFVVMYHN